MEFRVPYGKEHLTFALPDDVRAEWIAPKQVAAASDPLRVVSEALDAPVGRAGYGGARLADFSGARSAAIAINDKTRPVPHSRLLPPLLQRLEALGLPREAITLVIATGTHPVMPPDEYPAVVPPDVLNRYRVICHDCDDEQSLVYLGETVRGTPVWINRHFAQADLRVVVGNIEPHQFQGFSGGVKSAAIGLAGRATVNRNHALMMEPGSQLGQYTHNPARQDVEDMGRKIGVQFALNAVLNGHKEIVAALAGDPVAVMQAGIPLAIEICQVAVPGKYDLIIASPGGHPKDINLYQTQKGLAHAGLIAKEGGTVLLVAACPEGTGSRGYEAWMQDVRSFDDVFAKLKREGFRVGPHKAFQIARDAAPRRVLLLSQMAPDFVRRLLLTPVASLDEALAMALAALPSGARVGVMPAANATIPVIHAA